MYFHSDPLLIGWLHICYEFSVGFFSCVNLSMYEINSRLPFFVYMFHEKTIKSFVCHPDGKVQSVTNINGHSGVVVRNSIELQLGSYCWYYVFKENLLYFV